MLPNIGLPELILILAIALLVLGPKKLPEVGSALGKSIREFRKASTEIDEATRGSSTEPVSRSDVPPAGRDASDEPTSSEEYESTLRSNAVASVTHKS